MPKYAIAIHGGAGNITRDNLKPELEETITSELKKIIEEATDVVAKNGSALEAVSTAVRLLEDSPYFNAGVGSVFTHAGTHELDASIMEGHFKNAGAVAGIRQVKNPIMLSRRILEESEHVLLISEGAEEFARIKELEMVENDFFSTEHRRKQWEKLNQGEATKLDHDVDPEAGVTGTVGAVAVDQKGHVAAATSSGGMTNKRYGRVGDSAIIGAGTYADNKSCAVSCTGTGEHFIRLSAAHKVSDFIKYLDLTISEACRRLIFERLPEIGGKGGLIAVDPFGNIEMPFNTKGMYRASYQKDGELKIALFEDDNPLNRLY